MPHSKDTPRTAGWKKADYSAAPPKMKAAKGALKKVVLRSILAIRGKDYDKIKDESLLSRKPFPSERDLKSVEGPLSGQSTNRGVVGYATGQQYLVIQDDGTWGKSFFSLAEAYGVNDTVVMPLSNDFHDHLEFNTSNSCPADDLPEKKLRHKGQGEMTFWAEGPAKGRKCLIEEEDGRRHLASLYTDDGSELREGEILHIRYEV